MPVKLRTEIQPAHFCRLVRQRPKVVVVRPSEVTHEGLASLLQASSLFSKHEYVLVAMSSDLGDRERELLDKCRRRKNIHVSVVRKISDKDTAYERLGDVAAAKLAVQRE